MSPMPGDIPIGPLCGALAKPPYDNFSGPGGGDVLPEESETTNVVELTGTVAVGESILFAEISGFWIPVNNEWFENWIETQMEEADSVSTDVFCPRNQLTLTITTTKKSGQSFQKTLDRHDDNVMATMAWCAEYQ